MLHNKITALPSLKLAIAIISQNNFNFTLRHFKFLLIVFNSINKSLTEILNFKFIKYSNQ